MEFFKASPKPINQNSFTQQNDSGHDTSLNPTKKRKLSIGKDVDTSSNCSLNSSSISLFSPSWETKLLKADLLESQTRIVQLKKELDHQNTIQANLEVKYTQKQQMLEKAEKYYETKTAEMEKVISRMRKKENSSKEELVKSKNQMETLKQTYEDRIYEIEMEKRDTEQNNRYEINELQNEISELQRRNDELEIHYSNSQDELIKLSEMNDDWRDKALRADALQNELDETKQTLQNVLSKVKSMEFEIQSFGEWKEYSKASHSRLINCSDLENEVTRLRKETKSLRESLGNKLLLEEQVNNFKSQLLKYESSSVDQISVQVKLDAVEKELIEWKAIGKQYCPKNAQVNPATLRSYIEKLFESQLILTNEKGSAISEKSSAETKLTDLDNQTSELTKQIELLRKSLKNHQGVMSRMQKKLTLITSERDSLKMLLENYEKDLTISQNVQSSNNSLDQQTRIRIDMLEKSVGHYKDLIMKLETDLKDAKSNSGCQDEDGLGFGNEQYDNLRKEINYLRTENEKLQKRRNELEIENENLRLRSNNLNGIEENRVKVLHFSANPADLAYEKNANEVVKLKAEIERLNIRIKQLESDNTAANLKLNETMNLTVKIKDMEKMQQTIENLESKNSHLKEVYKSASQEFREVCFMLFGYRVDRVDNCYWRITSMYAESVENFLSFRLTESGVLEMLETDYSLELAELVRRNLTPDTSLPYFLSILTMELFEKSTVHA